MTSLIVKSSSKSSQFKLNSKFVFSESMVVCLLVDGWGWISTKLELFWLVVWDFSSIFSLGAIKSKRHLPNCLMVCIFALESDSRVADVLRKQCPPNLFELGKFRKEAIFSQYSSYCVSSHWLSTTCTLRIFNEEPVTELFAWSSWYIFFYDVIEQTSNYKLASVVIFVVIYWH